MLKRWMPTPSLLLATISLVLALAGSAIAVNNAKITTDDLAWRAVTKKKLAPATVTEGKLGPGSVTQDKLAKGAVSESALAPHSLTDEAIKAEGITGASIDESTLQVTRVVGRLRATPNVTLPNNGDPQPVEIPGSWVQQADELDQLAGVMEVSYPVETEDCIVVLQMTLDDEAEPSAFATVFEGPGHEGGLSYGSASGFVDEPEAVEPGAEVTHTLTGQAFASCEPEVQGNPTITGLKLDVIGNR